MNGALVKVISPATAAKLAALATALGLPDVTGDDIASRSLQDQADFIYDVEALLDRAQAMFDEIRAGLVSESNAARARIIADIHAKKGSRLAHDRLDVVLVQRTDRDKRIDVLREQLAGKLPDDLYREAIYAKAITGTISPELLVIAASTPGCKIAFEADLRKLDKHARDFGGDIAAAVAAGSPKVPIGAPKLVIAPRESALKVVGS